MEKILLAEDDKDIREGIDILLRSQGYEVFTADDGIQALEILERQRVDLVIADIMMPRMNGIDLTMRIRQSLDIPILFLTAKSSQMDKVMGLNIGADDYITKPFTPMELLARVNSHLRRYKRFMDKINQNINQSRVHIVGGLELNEDTVELKVDGEDIKLTPMEFKILLLLIKNAGRVFSAEEIYENVWNERAVNTDTVMVHIRNIREKIEINPKEPKYLKVVWGIGYKIEKQG